jgi:hypothetical protein
MSRHGGSDSDVARGAGTAALKGAGLVLLAIIIGIVLLQVVDDGEPSGSTAPTPKPKATTTTVKKSGTTKTTTTTKAPTTPPREPSQLKLIVLNAGAPTGAAGQLSNALKGKGYTNQEAATDWSGANKKGTVVYCKSGLTREATALAVAVGNGATAAAFPSPAPPSSGNVDCVVAVGG